jgi:hypothetical protein
MFKKIVLLIALVPPLAAVAYFVVWICSEVNVLPKTFYVYFFKVLSFFFKIDSLLWNQGFLVLLYSYLAFILSILAIWIYRNKIRR